MITVTHIAVLINYLIWVAVIFVAYLFYLKRQTNVSELESNKKAADGSTNKVGRKKEIKVSLNENTVRSTIYIVGALIVLLKLYLHYEIGSIEARTQEILETIDNEN